MIETLKQKRDFDRVHKRGQVFGNRNLVLHYVKNELDHNRIGIVVSKKVSNRAVARNKIRRRLKEIYRLDQERIEVGYDLIFIAKASCLTIDYETLKKSFFHILKKKRLCK